MTHASYHQLFGPFIGAHLQKKAYALVVVLNDHARDAADIQQDLVVTLLQAKADYNAAKGAWTSFAKTVIDRQAALLLQKARAEKRGPDVYHQSLDAYRLEYDIGEPPRDQRAAEMDPPATSPPQNHAEIRVLALELWRQLPPTGKRLLKQLLLHGKLREAADVLALSRRGLNHHKQLLRRRLAPYQGPLLPLIAATLHHIAHELTFDRQDNLDPSEPEQFTRPRF